MKNEALKKRTKDFDLRIIRMVDAVPETTVGDVLGRQIVRSAASVAANYRASCRARSRAGFIAKMALVEEEADESALWLALIAESGQLKSSRTEDLHREAGELAAIAVASIRTARARSTSPQSALRTPRSR